MDADQYLERIGVDTRPEPSLDSLANLQERHILSVPFENLDIPLGHGILLDRAHLFDKIVHRRRGGYCFELNGLFGDLLTALGYTVRPLMARVWYRNPPEVPGLTHTLNLVTIDGTDYLVDVGFGGTTARKPIPFADSAEVEDADGIVRLTTHGDHGFMLYRRVGDEWQAQFSVTGQLAYASDMALGNHFTSTSPLTHFTNSIVAGRFTPTGRYGLVNRVLTHREGNTEVDSVDLDDASYLDALATYMGINLGDEAELLLAQLRKFDP